MSCLVSPSASKMIDSSTSSMRVGVCWAVSQVVSATPSTVAITCVDPRPFVVARPLLLMVATPKFVTLQLITRLARGLPALSRGTAEYCTTSPNSTRAESGDSVTERTGTGTTVTLVLPLLFEEVAVIVTVPLRRPVTLPVDVPVEITTAIEVSLLVQVAFLLTAEPLALVTVSIRLCPIRIVGLAGVTTRPGADCAGARSASSGMALGAEGISPQLATSNAISAAGATRTATDILFGIYGGVDGGEGSAFARRRYSISRTRDANHARSMPMPWAESSESRLFRT